VVRALLDEQAAKARYGTFARMLDEISKQVPDLAAWNLDFMRSPGFLKDTRNENKPGCLVSAAHLRVLRAEEEEGEEEDEDDDDDILDTEHHMFEFKGSIEWLSDIFRKVDPALKKQFTDMLRGSVCSFLAPVVREWTKVDEDDDTEPEVALRKAALEGLRKGSLKPYKTYQLYLENYSGDENEYAEEFCCAAARSGSFECFDYVSSGQEIALFEFSVLAAAAEGEAWSLVERIMGSADYDDVEEAPDGSFFFEAVAEKGDLKTLDMVLQKYQSYPEHAAPIGTEYVGDWAAHCGRIDVLEWAYSKQRESGVTLVTSSMWSRAAASGQVHVLEWGKKNEPEVFLQLSAHGLWEDAAMEGWMGVLDWLWYNTDRTALEQLLEDVVAVAASQGHIRVLEWVAARIRDLMRADADQRIGSAVQSFLSGVPDLEAGGHLEVAWWLYSHSHDPSVVQVWDVVNSRFPEMHSWAARVGLPGWNPAAAAEAAAERGDLALARWIFTSFAPAPPGPGEPGRDLCHMIVTSGFRDLALLDLVLAAGFPWDNRVESLAVIVRLQLDRKFTINRDHEFVSALLERMPARDDPRVIMLLLAHGYANVIPRARELGFTWNPDEHLTAKLNLDWMLLRDPKTFFHPADAVRILLACARLGSAEYSLASADPWFREHTSDEDRCVARGVALAVTDLYKAFRGSASSERLVKATYRAFLAEFHGVTPFTANHFDRFAKVLLTVRDDLEFLLDAPDLYFLLSYAVLYDQALLASILDFRPDVLRELSADSLAALVESSKVRWQKIPAQFARSLSLLPSARKHQSAIFLLACGAGDLNFLRSTLSDPLLEVAPDAAARWVHAACEMGNAAVLRCVLEHPMLASALAACQQEFLQHACDARNAGVLVALLDHPAVDPNSDKGGFNLLRTVLATHDADFCRAVLLHPRVDPCVDDQAVLAWACRKKSSESCHRGWELSRLLTHPQIDPGANNQAALRIACAEGNADSAHVLIMTGRVDPTVDDQALLRAAAAAGKAGAPVLSVLWPNSRTDVGSIGRALWCEAVQHQRVETVEVLSRDARMVGSLAREHTPDSFFVALGAAGNAKLLRAMSPVRRAFTDAQTHLILMKAGELGHLECVQVLVNEWRVDPGRDDQACLRQAVAASLKDAAAAAAASRKILLELLEHRQVDPGAASAELFDLAVADLVDLSAPGSGGGGLLRRLERHPRIQSFPEGGLPIMLAAVRLQDFELFQRVLHDRRSDPAARQHLLLRSLCAAKSCGMLRMYLRSARAEVPVQVLLEMLRGALAARCLAVVSALLVALPGGLALIPADEVLAGLMSALDADDLLDLLGNDAILLPQNVAENVFRLACASGAQGRRAALALLGRPAFVKSPALLHEAGLMVAAAQNHAELLGALLEHPNADVGFADFAVLWAAFAQKSVAVVSAVLPHSMRCAYRRGGALALARLALEALRQAAVDVNRDMGMLNLLVRIPEVRAAAIYPSRHALDELYEESCHRAEEPEFFSMLMEVCIVTAVENGDLGRARGLLETVAPPRDDPLYQKLLEDFPWMPHAVRMNDEARSRAARGDAGSSIPADAKAMGSPLKTASSDDEKRPAAPEAAPFVLKPATAAAPASGFSIGAPSIKSPARTSIKSPSPAPASLASNAKFEPKEPGRVTPFNFASDVGGLAGGEAGLSAAWGAWKAAGVASVMTPTSSSSTSAAAGTGPIPLASFALNPRGFGFQGQK
jgi:hypothetical protein